MILQLGVFSPNGDMSPPVAAVEIVSVANTDKPEH
jgi:hypothetical protein